MIITVLMSMLLATITDVAVLFQSPPGVRLRPPKTKAKGTWSLYHQPPQPPAVVSQSNLSTSPNRPKPSPLSWSAPITSVYRTYVTSSIASQGSSPVLWSRTSSIMSRWTNTTDTAPIHTEKPTSSSDKNLRPLHLVSSMKIHIISHPDYSNTCDIV